MGLVLGVHGLCTVAGRWACFGMPAYRDANIGALYILYKVVGDG